uniref:Uncharacterized protein n=3 Tax=Candidatus Kentrum sp. MB TaxID=2138164 RepID=A0A450XU32_9GAMM|nr:MAG: hypothetical protein BECKMB1821G_GA0114241_11259 [Candidatus Kentron sp. MB]
MRHQDCIQVAEQERREAWEYTWATFFKALKQLGVISPRIVEHNQRYMVYA